MNQFIPATVPVVARFKSGLRLPIIAWEVRDIAADMGENEAPVPGLVGLYIEQGSTYLMIVDPPGDGFVGYEYEEGD